LTGGAAADQLSQLLFLEEPGLSFIMKLIVYNPFYKDNPKRNENNIQIFARNPVFPVADDRSHP